MIAFDLLASIASRLLGFPYAWASIGSFAVYAAVGVLAARLVPGASLSTAAVAAGVAGFTDATAGWGLSWLIGPGRPLNSANLTVGRWFRVASSVVLLGVVFGLIGAFVEQWVS